MRLDPQRNQPEPTGQHQDADDRHGTRCQRSVRQPCRGTPGQPAGDRTALTGTGDKQRGDGERLGGFQFVAPDPPRHRPCLGLCEAS